MADVTYAISWDPDGSKLYHTGVSHAVAYLKSEKDTSGNSYCNGQAWDGLISVEESPDGADANDFYANNNKYITLRGIENHKGSIKCYTYPTDTVGVANGEKTLGGVHVFQQTRETIGFTYREQVGNDTEFDDYSYAIHFVYGATLSPSTRTHETINDSPSPEEISFDYETVPVSISSTIDGKKLKNSAHVVINVWELDEATKAKLSDLEAILFGSVTGSGDSVTTVEPRLPLPDQIFTLLGISDT